MNVSLFARARALFLAFLVPGLALAAIAPAAQALPTLTITSPQIVEGNTGTKQLVFNATLSSASATDVWMDWDTSYGTADGGTDYVALSNQRLNFPAGTTSATISVTVIGDTLGEGDEFFYIDPRNINGAVLAGETWPKGWIMNDDTLPALSIADASIVEEAGSVQITVSLAQPATSPVSFDVVSASGTAASGTDFPAYNQNQIIQPGGTATSFWVPVTDDATVEGNETFTLSLANLSGASIGDGSAVVTIVNDDGATGPKLSIWDNTSSVTEGDTGTKLMNFEVTLSSAAVNDVFFDAFTLNNSAVAGQDYVAKSVTAQKIPAGQTSAFFSVAINGDIEVENQESLYVNVANVTGARLGDSQAYGNIEDNDIGGSGSIAISDVRVTEGNSGTKNATFTVTMSAASNSLVSFDLGTSGGTAFGGEDFVPLYLQHQTFAPGETSKTFNVVILGDTTVERDEYFYVTLLGANGTSTNTGQNARIYILNDDANGDPMITVDNATAVEGNSGTSNMVFTVRLAAATTHQVSYRIQTFDNFSADSVGQTSTPFDYTPTTLNLVIPAGSTTGTFSVPVKGDTAVEGPEYFNVVISNIVGAYWDGENQAYGQIIDDDQNVTLSLAGYYWVNEGDSGTKTMWATVNLSPNAVAPVTFNLSSSNGTATAGSDYVALSATNQTIAVGQTSKTFGITINSDAVVESDETFTLNLSNVSGAAVGTGSATVTIRNDDVPPPSPYLNISDVTVSEGNSGTKTATFTVSLTSAWSSAVSFDIATGGGLADPGVDFVAKSLVGQTIAAGQTSKTFAVTINGDTTVEPDEWFRVTVSNVTGGAILVDSEGIGTITNDDFVATPALSINDQFTLEGNSGTRYVVMTVSLSAPTDHAVTFNLATADGTAVAPGDYTTVNTTGTIPANSQSVQFNIPTIPDTDIEQDPETFYVNVTNVSGATVADGQGSVWIGNDDWPPTPSLTIDDVTVAEGNSGTKTMTFTVSLSVASDAPITFDIRTQDDTATADSDYVAKTLTNQSIAAGQTSKTFTVTMNGDTSYEADEKFWVFLSNIQGNVSVVDDSGIGTITNDDVAPEQLLSISDATITEGDSGQKLATYTISLAAPATSMVFFDADSANGTAIAGSDYVLVGLGNWNFGIGETSITQTVKINGDTTPEADEVFYINLSNVTGATVAKGQGVFTIVNDDSGGSGPTLSVNDVTIAEGNSGTKTATFTVTLSAAQSGPVTFDIGTANGTATFGSDYVAKATAGVRIPAGSTSKTFVVSINGDTAFEPDETFTVQLSNAVGATIADNEGLGTITNDDSGTPPTLSIADASISEGNSGDKLLNFTVTMSAASVGQVSFDFATASGTATAGSDYTASNFTLNLVPGETSKVISVQIFGDTAVEPDETFTVNLSNIVGTATFADGSAVGTITNDDGGSTPSLSIGDVSISEGNSGTKVATFTVNLSAAASGAVTYDIATANGTATAGSDFVASSLVGQSIAAGQTSKTFAVTINGDATVESDETFNVNVSNVSGATVGDGAAVGTITNDDSAGGATLSIADVSIAEGNSGTKTATFTVSLSAAQSGPVLFDIATANGTATSGSDYVAKTTAGVRIAAGATSKTFVVTINGDTVSEPDENFTVNLSNPSGATLADGQAVGTITNDDAAATPTLSIADASVSEGNSGTKVLTFTVSLSPAAAGTVSYDIATSNGTATSGSDYVASSLVGQTISAGGTSKTFAVTINGDATTESNETFNVTLTNVSGATLGDGTAVGTITNDDGGGSGPTLSIGDVTVAEGNSLSKQVTFTVSLSAAASTAVTYNIATANGTATAPTDYATKSLTGQTIAAGVTSKTFVVAVKGDTVAEANETFTVNVTSVVGATVADGQAVGTITNDDAALVSVARFDARGLVDDIDDGNHVPQVSTNEYALLLADTANKLCTRTSAATVVGIDGIENAAVLRDLADATNAICAKTRYQAVMGEGAELGFLVEATADTDARGVQVLDKPKLDATAKLSSLQVQASGHDGPITLLLPQALSTDATVRNTQLRNLGQAVQAQLASEPQARLVLIGNETVPGMLDLTARSLPAKSTLPAERVLVSPTLLREFGKTTIAFPALPANETPAQVLQLQR